MKKTITRSLVLAIPMLFIGCFTSDDNSGSGGSKINVGPEPTPISLTEVSDASYIIEGSKIISKEEDSYCDREGVLQLDEYSNERNFEIADGILSMWNEYDCMATTYTGGGSTLEGGVWTVSGEAEIPDRSNNSGGCGDFFNLPKGVITKLSFKNGKETIQYSGTFCWAENIAENSENKISHGCNSYQSRYSNDEVVTVTLNELNLTTNAIIETLTYNEKSCTLNSPGYNRTKLTQAKCTEAYAAYTASGTNDSFYYEEWNRDDEKFEVAEAELQTCLKENGFPISTSYNY